MYRFFLPQEGRLASATACRVRLFVVRVFRRRWSGDGHAHLITPLPIFYLISSFEISLLSRHGHTSAFPNIFFFITRDLHRHFGAASAFLLPRHSLDTHHSFQLTTSVLRPPLSTVVVVVVRFFSCPFRLPADV